MFVCSFKRKKDLTALGITYQMCVFQGSKRDVITACVFVPGRDSPNTTVLQMKLNRTERLKLGDKKAALAQICIWRKKEQAGFFFFLLAVAAVALDAGELESFESIFMVIKKSSKSPVPTNKMLAVLYCTSLNTMSKLNGDQLWVQWIYYYKNNK